METTNLGRIGPVPQGDFKTENLPYRKYDMVMHNGDGYISMIEDNNEEPGTGQNWKKIVEKGLPGPKGETFIFDDLTPMQIEQLKGDVIAYNSLSETDKNDLAARVPVNGTVAEGVQEAVSGGEVYSAYKDIVKEVDTITNLDFILLGGSYSTTSGNFAESVNWLSTDKIGVSNYIGKEISVRGYGTNPSVSVTFLWMWKNGVYYQCIGNGESNTFTFEVEEDVTEIALRVEGAPNIGLNPNDSIFNETLKIEVIETDKLIINSEAIKERIDSEQLLNIESEISELKNKKGIEFVYPESFPYKDIKIHRIGYDYFPSDFASISDLYADVELTELVYVDPILGLNTNDGSELNPFKSVNGAISAGYNNIKLKNIGGFYPRGTNIGDLVLNSQMVNFKLSAEDGVIMANSDNSSSFTFTNEGNDVYKTTRSSVTNVLKLTPNIQPITKVDTLAELDSLDYGFYTSGSDLYIKSITPIGSDFEICLGVLQRITADGLKNVILENIKFYGSQGDGGITIKSTTEICGNVYLKNITSDYNRLGNGVAVVNADYCYTENCGGTGNLRDAMNYHTSNSGFPKMKIFEFNCFGYNCGVGSDELSSNGSTFHNGCVGVRIGSRFENCRGPVVADVNSGTKSINFNVVALNSLLTGGACYQIEGADSEMWLHSCGAYSELSSQFSIRAYNGATCYVGWNNRLINSNEGNVKNVF